MFYVTEVGCLYKYPHLNMFCETVKYSREENDAEIRLSHENTKRKMIL
jgi:hypothetical protein